MVDNLSEEEKKALRGSKFAPLPPPPPPSQSRLAHPGGAIKTNKAAALAKFLERKLQEPRGLESLDPDLIELAVENAKRAVKSGGSSSSRRTVKHVDSFDDPQGCSNNEKLDDDDKEKVKKKKRKRKNKLKQKNKTNKREASYCSTKTVEGEVGCYPGKKPKKKKLKLKL